MASLALAFLPHQAGAGFCAGGLIEESRCKAAVDIMRDLLPREAPQTEPAAVAAPAASKVEKAQEVPESQEARETQETSKTPGEASPRPYGLLPAPLPNPLFGPSQLASSSGAPNPAAGENAAAAKANLAASAGTADAGVAVVLVPYPTERPRNHAALYAQNAALKEGALADQAPAGGEGQVVAAALKKNVCLDVDSISEKDIANARTMLKKPGICVSETVIAEHGRRWRLFIIENRSKGAGPLFVVPHDNEDAAFVTGVYGVATYGGTLIAVEAGEQRFFEGQDPNRNFSTSSAAAKSCRAQRRPAPLYTGAILARRSAGAPVIALHSNANGWSGNGGSGNVSILKTGGGTKPFISAIARSRRLVDEDTMIILAGTGEAGAEPAAGVIRYFTERAGVNVLYEQVSAKSNDCSLSNHAALNGIGPYFNIEVEDGDAKTQKVILDKLADYLGLK